MKVETQELPDSEVQLSFEIDDARLERAMDAAYRRLAGRVNISGFRRGKAPRQLVERVLGREALLEEALNHLLPEVYEEARQEANVRALTDPEFSVESLTPLKAKATVVVPPRVDLGDYQSIKHEAPETTVPAEEVDGVLDQLREAHAQWVPVERAAAFGDRLTIDVEGRAENARVFNQEDVDYVLEEGSPNPMPGFAEALVGIEIDETREFELTEELPEDLPEPPEGAEPPTPRKMTFKVTAKDVKEKELPTLDDDFATGLGAYNDLEDLRFRVEKQLRDRAESTARMDAQQKILDEAVTSATVELPHKLIHHEMHRLQDRLARQLDSGGFSIEQYLRARHTSAEDFEAELHEDAERSLKRSLVLQEIATRESIEISDDDVDLGIREAFARENASEKVIAAALRREELRERVRTALLEERAAKWLVDHAMPEVEAAATENNAADAPASPPQADAAATGADPAPQEEGQHDKPGPSNA
jgi:trigger factor